MNTFIKTLKLLWHNIIYFLILGIGYDFFCIGAFEYNLFGHYHRFSKFFILILFFSILTYYFFIKTLKNNKNSVFLLFFLTLSIIFCISTSPMNDGFIPKFFTYNIHFFFYDFFPTWVFIHQGLYLISHIYQHNLEKNNIKLLNENK